MLFGVCRCFLVQTLPRFCHTLDMTVGVIYDICRLALNVLFVALPCLLENIGGDCWLRVLLADVKVTSGYGGGRGGSFATGMSVGVGVGWVVLVWCVGVVGG